MNTIEQLKIALQIEEAKAAGKPIKWEVCSGQDRWIDLSPYPGSLMQSLSSGNEIRLTPAPQWTLGREINGHCLPEGQEWFQAESFTESDLPDGTRPLLVGEAEQKGDYWQNFFKRWIPVNAADADTNCYSCPRRTTRPLPAVEKWAKEKAAFAEGEAIQVRAVDAEGTGDWLDAANPTWDVSGVLEYRRKPEPVFVDLGPEDVPIGSVIKHEAWVEGSYAYPDVHSDHVKIDACEKTFAALRTDGWLIHRPSKPGVWEKCEKQKP